MQLLQNITTQTDKNQPHSQSDKRIRDLEAKATALDNRITSVNSTLDSRITSVNSTLTGKINTAQSTANTANSNANSALSKLGSYYTKTQVDSIVSKTGGLVCRGSASWGCGDGDCHALLACNATIGGRTSLVDIREYDP